jgi:tRNA modification GTPase
MTTTSSKPRTVAAIATANAPGGIGIVRISGAEALKVAARVFIPKSGAQLSASEGYRLFYGHAAQADGSVIDEALCSVFRAPKSYTGEDCAEISCHGGLYVTRKLLRAVLAAGASPAPAGEFTKRAYLNGRIGLEQAEAVAALINARGEAALKAANGVLGGALGKRLTLIANGIILCSAEVAAWVDYPDEDLGEPSAEKLLEQITPLARELDSLLRSYENGRILTEGVDTVICGRPNTGKSTLMNLLCGQELAIVTHVEGTTRDVLEANVLLGEIPLRLADTAGLREDAGLVEKIGIERARERITGADLLLCVLDSSAALKKQDIELLELCRGRRAVIVLNKADLPGAVSDKELEQYGLPIVRLCAKSGQGLDALQAVVESLLCLAELDTGAATLISERQRSCCELAHKQLCEAMDALRSGVTLDAVQLVLEDSISPLLELRGYSTSSAVTDAVFSHFCVGK